ncbi:MAG: phosphoenolpyruvate synthase [Candidatus Melainabacteria bacterium]|nr:phosphoenolpyruvate synthase [Candidatus Melainabacteria bacterium]
MAFERKYIRWFDKINLSDLPTVGGKNASLGEMINAFKDHNINVPLGFATTSNAYWDFLDFNKLKDKISSILSELENNKIPLDSTGRSIRKLFKDASFPVEIAEAIKIAYKKLCGIYQHKELDLDVAVRSSATAEDLPDASFAGQQETFLNICSEGELLEACRNCFASLFTDRAISYRIEKGFDHMKIALSVGVQKMVRSDKSGSGVMFTIDPETGFKNAVVINAAWGLGENVVQGTITPDEYVVFKPFLDNNNTKPIIERTLGTKEKKMIYGSGGSKSTKNIDTPKNERWKFVLNDDEILQLAHWACIIETHYGKPMDIEWAKDGETKKIYIVQARPETVESRKLADSLKVYKLKEKGKVILSGTRIGEAIATGKVCKVTSSDNLEHFKEGSILVTEMTDPDWVPIMRKAAGIITDHGGRTCHAAIVSRELGIPAIVGTSDATQKLKDDQEVTMSCAEGDHGLIYEGILKYDAENISFDNISKTSTRIMLNIASPAAAFRWWRLPSEGIGLARMEFIVNNIIKVHPMALAHFERVTDEKTQEEIIELTRGYKTKQEYFIDKLACGIGKIAASQYPEPVIVRMSDFKTNEYANLIGGAQFEPKEENPMLGFRGASRYYSDKYKDGFALECKAIKKAREIMGFKNVVIMIPFCRTLEEADKVLHVLATNGLGRGENDLQIYVMCEIPSNVILAEEFAKKFDGFSIGSNDLTQLVLGVDRDSADLAELFDERNEAVKIMIRTVIEKAHKLGCKVGICGQAPSDYPDFADFLVEAGIDSISLNPDSIIHVKQRVAELEKQQPLQVKLQPK